MKHRTCTVDYRVLVLLFFSFLLLVGVTQIRAKAYQNEMAGNADEPAHFITGLMMHDYVASGFPGNPLGYARNYYQHYPKVALGHWPPFFYMVQSAWMLVFGATQTSVMLLMAVLTVFVATILFVAVAGQSDWAAGIAAGTFFICLPMVQIFSSAIMAEICLTLVVFVAVAAYGRYLDTGDWRYSAAFGISASAALMTKGSGIELAFVPLIALIATRRWNMVARLSFWLPAAIVGLSAGPWYLFVPGAQHETVARYGGVTLITPRLMTTLAVWAGMLGVVPTVLAILGVSTVLWKVWGRPPADLDKADEPRTGILIAGMGLLVGAYVCRLIIGAWEDRQLVTTLPVLVMFSFAGLQWLLNLPAVRRWPKWVPLGAAGLVFAGVILADMRNPQVKPHFGFAEASEALVADPGLRGSVFLVCSGSEGEGALIEEVALREHRPGHVILRSTKVLAVTDWMGYRYKPQFPGEQEMFQYLENIPVGVVAIDSAGGATPHGHMLLEGMRKRADHWLQMGRYGDVELYRLRGHEGVAPKLPPMEITGFGKAG